MLRIIVRVEDWGVAANVGGGVHADFKTFDLELPEVEALLRDKTDKWSKASIVGAEILPHTEGGAP